MNRTNEPFATGSGVNPTSDGLRQAASSEPVLLHPHDVVAHPKMTVAEKRALLASWASDARAVENSPTLRRLDSGATVELAEILEAIRALDQNIEGSDTPRSQKTNLLPFAPRGTRQFAKRHMKVVFRRRNDDDDDPPSAPAAAAIPRAHPVLLLNGCRPELLPAA